MNSKGNAAPGYVAPLSRFLLSLIFILSGITKVTSWSEAAAMMRSKGIPAVPLFLTGASLIEVIAGTAVLIGNRTRPAAVILFLYLIPVTLTMHNFWAVSGAEQGIQSIMFLKNLAIMGGLLEAANHGAGAYSVDELRTRVRPVEKISKAA
jgi:putative oxidoreductase